MASTVAGWKTGMRASQRSVSAGKTSWSTLQLLLVSHATSVMMLSGKKVSMMFSTCDFVRSTQSLLDV